jgi:DNA ligase-1
MKSFARLYAELDANTATNAKVEALRRYFAQAKPADAAWAVYFLAGGRPRQVVPAGALRLIAQQRAGIADWLFEECYQAVGDLAETIAHVMPAPTRAGELGLAEWIEQRLLPLRGADPAVQLERIGAWFDELDAAGRYLFVKLVGGGFRVGVSKLLVQRALAEHAGIDAKRVAQRMMGYTDLRAMPDAAAFERLVAAADATSRAEAGQPYPFFLAHALDGTPAGFDARLGAPTDWFVEWKYDGIRAQIVKRDHRVWIWSRGEELVTDRFPEIVGPAQGLPDGTVLDGEIVVWKDDRPASFNLLQQRIGRKTLTQRVLADAPVVFIAYDLLEWQGDDWRGRPQHARRGQLESTVAGSGLRLSPIESGPDWPALAALREQSRARGVEGFMLKHRDARYGSGRTKAEGTWWKWKIEPLSVDAVLIYAQAGHGRRASIYTDYTFAVWSRLPRDAEEAQAAADAIERREPAAPDALQLVPFAKAYSGLSDEEFRTIDRVIRRTTIEKFGPVRSVRPTLVFELGFEGINRSSRHRSGLAVRFPRMLRIRDDKRLHEADTLATLSALLACGGGAESADPVADPPGGVSS